ncbi:MAG TPA: Nramp family divalent metal transporter [Selenomonadales bacterium]|nr:Nramp family divalent metal transporter [Selenomonadales bacterium]
MFGKIHAPDIKAREILKYIGPGMFVTIGFIDPGNWASNIAAGASYGYTLLWMVTLSTIMLIVLQHNAAHLGIVTGYCLSEATVAFLPKRLAHLVVLSAMAASVATAMAEILGMAIALRMLFDVPITAGAVAAAVTAFIMQWTNSYRRLEKWIIGFVSLVGLSFLFEMTLVQVDWVQAARGWVVPEIPTGALPVIMSVLGAVVMPHNLFLHSEIIQSRQWNLENDEIISRQLKYEFLDTFFSMLIGWAINSAMILLAATAFFQLGVPVETLEQAEGLLRPLLGGAAATTFALALLFSGFSSTTTAGLAGGSIFAGLFREPYNIRDPHTAWGVGLTYFFALAVIFFITDPFAALVTSQILLSVQLPVTIFTQIYLTSSPAVMGKYANRRTTKLTLFLFGAIVSLLNLFLLVDLLSR